MNFEFNYFHVYVGYDKNISKDLWREKCNIIQLLELVRKIDLGEVLYINLNEELP